MQARAFSLAAQARLFKERKQRELRRTSGTLAPTLKSAAFVGVLLLQLGQRGAHVGLEFFCLGHQ